MRTVMVKSCFTSWSSITSTNVSNFFSHQCMYVSIQNISWSKENTNLLGFLHKCHAPKVHVLKLPSGFNHLLYLSSLHDILAPEIFSSNINWSGSTYMIFNLGWWLEVLYLEYLWWGRGTLCSSNAPSWIRIGIGWWSTCTLKSFIRN